MKTTASNYIVLILSIFLGCSLLNSCTYKLGMESPGPDPISKSVHDGSCVEFLLDNMLMTEGGMTEAFIAIGISGVGTSTLLNSILQKNVFKSGISLEQGLTKKMQGYRNGNTLYIDTPNLSDIKIKSQAMDEIGEVLQLSNKYKIVFVVTLESGRIRPTDLIAINTVCDAIKTNFEYGIVFNKLTKKVYKVANEQGLNQYFTTLNKHPYTTVLLKRDIDLEDSEGSYFKTDSKNRKKLLGFIDVLPINISAACDVIAVNYKKKLVELEESSQKKIQELTDKSEGLAKLTTRLQEKHSTELCSLYKRVEEQKEEISCLSNVGQTGPWLKEMDLCMKLEDKVEYGITTPNGCTPPMRGTICLIQ